jgi:hypothetical protein
MKHVPSIAPPVIPKAMRGIPNKCPPPLVKKQIHTVVKRDTVVNRSESPVYV